MSDNRILIIKRIEESIQIKRDIASNAPLIDMIGAVSLKIANCLLQGKKIILCGNGGSASDALHFAGEILGRFQLERAPWPAVVLNADVASITAIANDYGYDEVFARQAKAHAKIGDVFIGISTSGNSSNVICAAEVAKTNDAILVGLLGGDGGKLGKMVDYPIIIPSKVTARIQECHITTIHIICELVEKMMQAYE